MYSKILAPLDGSKFSECSLVHLNEIATGCQVREVILFMILEQHYRVGVEYANQSQINEVFQQQAKEQKQDKEAAEQYLAGVNENIKKQGVTVQNVISRTEGNQSVAEVILNYANSNSIDLIIMSTHGRSGITRWAFGSVADRVVRHSRIPVLIVSPAGCRK